jgi:plasmid rolling circle replication initiator protein Rep
MSNYTGTRPVKQQTEVLDGKESIWNQKRTMAEQVQCKVASVAAIEEDPVRRRTLKRWLERLRECSAWLAFKRLPEADVIGRERVLAEANFCHVRGCPVCEWRRSARMRAKLYQVIPKLVAPGSRFIFLTLTVKNCAVQDLRDTLRDMNEAWRRITQTKKWQRTIKGFLKTVEITRGSNGTAHPHFHVLLVVDQDYFKKKRRGTREGYYTHAEMRALWSRCLRVSYEPQVRLNAVSEGNEEEVIPEIAKYATKTTDLTSDSKFFEEYLFQVSGLRFVSTGGVIRQLLGDLEQESEGATPDASNEPAETEEYVWHPLDLHYRRRLP